MKSHYVQIEKYVYDQKRPLGKGACGIVYLGFYAKGEGDENTFLAIKEIPVRANNEIADSLLQEINVLRRLKHKNIVAFIDAKKTDDCMYLVTEYCNQGTIEDLIMSHNLSHEDVQQYFRQIADAFKYIRSKKIIHRDVKPQNILLHDGQVKIGDFGLAKMIDTGTPVFMAPQIIKQETYSDLSDIWSLGVTFYFMLFRHYPWEEVNPLKLLKKIELKVNNLIPEGAIISDKTKDLLQRMLVIDEKKRISWEEFFNHPIIKVDDQTQDIQYDDIEDLTENSFLVKSNFSTISDQENEEIQEYGRRLTLHYQNCQKSLTRARRARDYIEFERQCGFFFIQSNIAKELESQKRIKQNIAEDLYIKCMFLLYKRVYAQFIQLNQILIFQSNSSGLIQINQEDYQALLESDTLKSDLNRIRSTTARDYDFSRKEFQKWKQLLYDAQYSLPSFELIDRGDAYQDNIIEENENLIIAFNDNFLKLFLLLANELEPIYQSILENQQTYSKQYIYAEKKIDIIFVYDLIIVLAFRNVVKLPNPESNLPLINFHKYNEDRKRIEEIELLHRIHKQKCQWEKLNQ